jgi:hypothetical protein
VPVRKMVLLRFSAVEWGRKGGEDLATGGNWDVLSVAKRRGEHAERVFQRGERETG